MRRDHFELGRGAEQFLRSAGRNQNQNETTTTTETKTIMSPTHGPRLCIIARRGCTFDYEQQVESI